jgi:hypothetical protein
MFFSPRSRPPSSARSRAGKEPATRVEALAFLRAALGDEANADAAKAVAEQDGGRTLESLVSRHYGRRRTSRTTKSPPRRFASARRRPPPSRSSRTKSRRVALADALAKTALERVSANDQDQEVKEAAIAAAGATLAALADAIDDDDSKSSESKTSAALVRALLERRGDAATRERAADALAAALQRAGPALDATLFDPASGLATLALAKLVAHFRDAREDRALKAAGLDAVAALFERRSASALGRRATRPSPTRTPPTPSPRRRGSSSTSTSRSRRRRSASSPRSRGVAPEKIPRRTEKETRALALVSRSSARRRRRWRRRRRRRIVSPPAPSRSAGRSPRSAASSPRSRGPA